MNKAIFIQAKLANGDYITIETFLEDVRMIFRDACVSSNPTSDLHQKAIAIWSEFENLVRPVATRIFSILCFYNNDGFDHSDSVTCTSSIRIVRIL